MPEERLAGAFTRRACDHCGADHDAFGPDWQLAFCSKGCQYGYEEENRG